MCLAAHFDYFVSTTLMMLALSGLECFTCLCVSGRSNTRATPVPATRRNTVPDQSSLFEAGL